MDKPESVLPVEIVQDYQKFRETFVEETSAFLDALRILEGAHQMPDNLANEIGRQLVGEFVPLRKHMLTMMSDYFRTLAEAHLAIQQLEAVSDAHNKLAEEHNKLVEALKHGDLTHDLTDAFLEQVQNELESEWGDELNKSISREGHVGSHISAGMIAALEGAHVPAVDRPAVAKALMQAALKQAGKLPDKQPQIAEGRRGDRTHPTDYRGTQGT